MSKRLRKYLEAIENSRPISLKAFIAEAVRLGVPAERLKSGIDSERKKGDTYWVTISDTTLARSLWQLALSKDATRIDASVTGRSHGIAVAGSYLLIRTLAQHPEVVLFDEEGNFTPARGKKKALIIENRQNFLSIARCLDCLKDHFGLTVNRDYEIIFGAGKEITNRLHTHYLSGFEQIDMLFDLDEGGLSIARILSVRVPETDCNFLIPDDVQTRFDRQVTRVDPKTIDLICKLAFDCPLLAPAARLIIESRKTLEQESYLI